MRAAVARLEAHKDALVRANAAVVGVEVLAIENARSVATLGRERQGSGILIGDDGLVLTIGYLILEADHVDLVLGARRRVPARVVAYDLASGFGLVQALAPLGLAPAPLGVSAAIADDEPLLVASGGDDADLSLARMVSRRAVLGLLGISHRRRALHRAGAHRPQRRRPLQRRRRAGRRRLAARRQRPRRRRGAARQHVRAGRSAQAHPARAARARRSRSSRRAWIGVNCVEAGGQVHIVRLAPESPAEAAGLEPGDVVLGVDGIEVADLASLYRALWRDERPDRDVLLEIQRGNERLRLAVHAIDRMETLSRPQGV